MIFQNKVFHISRIKNTPKNYVEFQNHKNDS
jgi:hypothetical protein